MQTVTIVAARDSLSPELGAVLLTAALLAVAVTIAVARLRSHRTREASDHRA